MTLPVIHRITQLDLSVQPWSWRFAEQRRADIDAHFAIEQREKPRIWNGRILLGRDPAFSEGSFSAQYFEADFASFLAWRDWGFPDRDVFNGFGMGALRCSDGAFLLGEMADHTANAGRIYFPAGTPDLDDVGDGAFDVAGSVVREVEEETGLTPADYRAGAHWDCVVCVEALGTVTKIDVDLTGEELRARIEANLARQHQPELVSSRPAPPSALPCQSPPRFVSAFIEAQFA